MIQQNPDQKPVYSLSRPLGLACDTFSLFPSLLIIVIYCLPTVGPVNARNFNWTPLFVIFVIVLTLIGWIFHGRKQCASEVLEAIALSAENHNDNASFHREDAKEEALSKLS